MRRLLLVGIVAGCTEYEYAGITVGETFIQAEVGGRSDVLFVIDNSSSMSEEQALLGANFASFATLLAASEADFQLGVVTTDVVASDAGVFRGGILSPTTPDLASAAVAAFTVDTQGDRDEQGLAAAALAIDGRNPGFLRSDSTLNIAVFSDEDDHSPGPVEDWLYTYEEVVGRENMVVHAIVGDLPAGCASATSAADPGPRYVAAAVNTDGWRDSICIDDYTDVLTRVGLDLAGVEDTFVLDDFPNPATLSVSVDDVAVPEAPVDGWRYDPGLNAIVFDGAAIPAAGARIAVSYQRIADSVAPDE